MDYDIKAKPTLYNGINFRSRLEAKWACFFEKVGLDYQYEPCEINGYNPDFIITCKSDSYSTNKIIVEVKPSVFIDDEFKAEILRKYKNIPAHILILSDNPFTKTTSDTVSIGVGSQYLDDGDEEFIHTDLYDFEMKQDCFDFGSNYMIFDGMIEGKEDNRKIFMEFMDSEHLYLAGLWTAAGNKTQFKVNK